MICERNYFTKSSAIKQSLAYLLLAYFMISSPLSVLVMFCNFLIFYCIQNISPGMKLWGVVAEVNEKDLVVSLPGGLRGLVRASEAFDPVFGDEIKVIK